MRIHLHQAMLSLVTGLSSRNLVLCMVVSLEVSWLLSFCSCAYRLDFDSGLLNWVNPHLGRPLAGVCASIKVLLWLRTQSVRFRRSKTMHCKVGGGLGTRTLKPLWGLAVFRTAALPIRLTLRMDLATQLRYHCATPAYCHALIRRTL